MCHFSRLEEGVVMQEKVFEPCRFGVAFQGCGLERSANRARGSSCTCSMFVLVLQSAGGEGGTIAFYSSDEHSRGGNCEFVVWWAFRHVNVATPAASVPPLLCKD
jgi:hypothetical protein